MDGVGDWGELSYVHFSGANQAGANLCRILGDVHDPAMICYAASWTIAPPAFMCWCWNCAGLKLSSLSARSQATKLPYWLIRWICSARTAPTVSQSSFLPRPAQNKSK